MSRLIAFGCSYTYGHGLADCFVPPDHHGPQPSNLAWPTLLGQMLDMDVVNCSNPGASNTHILWKILNFEFKEDDICVVMWTHFDRYPFSQLNSDSTIVKWDGYDFSDIRFLPALDQTNLIIRNYILIHHGYLYLQSKNIKHVFALATTDAKFKKPQNIVIPTLLSGSSLARTLVDNGLDKLHPGPKTHENIAREFYNKLNVIH